MTTPTSTVTPSSTLPFGSWTSDPTDAEIDIARRVSALWGWVLAAGLISIAVGLAVLTIRWDIDRLALLVGLVFAVRGLADVITSASRPHRAMAIVGGGLGLIASGIALAWPGPTLFVLATVVGVWLLIDGLLNSAGAMLMRGPLWGLWLVAGVATVALGLWALAHPGATLAVLVAVIGVRAILGGFVEILASLELRRLPQQLMGVRHPAPPPLRNAPADPSSIAV